MKMKKVGLLPGFAQEAGTVFVRAADDMKIAHRFIGGIKRKHESQSVKRTADGQQNAEFSRPLRGLDDLFVGRSQH
jgi:hypothetical protein